MWTKPEAAVPVIPGCTALMYPSVCDQRTDPNPNPKAEAGSPGSQVTHQSRGGSQYPMTPLSGRGASSPWRALARPSPVTVSVELSLGHHPPCPEAWGCRQRAPRQGKWTLDEVGSEAPHTSVLGKSTQPAPDHAWHMELSGTLRALCCWPRLSPLHKDALHACQGLVLCAVDPSSRGSLLTKMRA